MELSAHADVDGWLEACLWLSPRPLLTLLEEQAMKLFPFTSPSLSPSYLKKLIFTGSLYHLDGFLYKIAATHITNIKCIFEIIYA
jgi:hypothetical protein